jgi:hypothetical protein
VVAAAGVDGTEALAGARQSGGARWRLEQLAPSPASTDDGRPDGAWTDLLSLYLEADFQGCLARAGDVDGAVRDLLLHDRRESASRLSVLAAGCAFGAGDRARARALLERLWVLEIDPGRALEGMPADFQSLADEARLVVVGRGRAAVTIESVPPGAEIHVDGSAHRCRAAPCTVGLIPGVHLIAGECLGCARGSLERRIEAPARISVELSPASAAEARDQLTRAMLAGADPGGPALLRLSTLAFDARFVVLCWRTDRVVRAALYDRVQHRVLARASAPAGPTGARSAVASVVDEWRGAAETRSLVSQPLFWTVAGGTALAAAVVVFFLTRPTETRHVIAFQ